METRRKSLLKTISWPFVHFTFVAGIIYFVLKYFTGEAEWEYVGFYGLMYLSLEMTFFYIHERLWARFGNGLR